MTDLFARDRSYRARTPREQEFEAVCRVMLGQGMKPTTANLYPGFGNGRTIRGNYVRIRTRLLLEYGYRKNEWTNRWEKA